MYDKKEQKYFENIRTELFFTKKNMIDLFENNDFEIVKILGSNSQSIIKYRRRFKFIKLFLFLLFEEFQNIQYFIVAKNKNQIDLKGI